MRDAPLLSPKRLWFALMLWFHVGRCVPLWTLLRYHRRPFAQDPGCGVCGGYVFPDGYDAPGYRVAICRECAEEVDHAQ